MVFYKLKAIELTGGPEDAHYLYSCYGVESPCRYVMRRYSDGRLINISENSLHTYWTIVDVPLVRDKVIVEKEVPQPDIDKLREQAEAWEEVYTTCRSLGMGNGDGTTCGRDDVLSFIQQLHKSNNYQNEALDKAAIQLKRREQVHDRTMVRLSRLRCIVDQLHREMNLD